MISEFPASLSSLRDFVNFDMSLACSPIEGSSNTYTTPDNPVPICEAKRILCDSPPESVLAFLANVR